MNAQKETRPVLFITYSYDDPNEASVLDVSGSVQEARRFAKRGITYRVERQSDGSYGNEQFVETRGVTRRQ